MPQLLRTLKTFYPAHKRDFPWRRIRDPYKILVSEIMLQQTQAGRVVPFYNRFTKEFPTAEALARAPLSKVLKSWQGLGYNRRAKFLHEAAKKLNSKDFLRSGEMNGSPTPARRKSVEFWETLPGVGHYTARAIVAFAFNKPGAFIETNIRTVFIYFCFPKKKKVSDRQLLPLVAEALRKSKMQPRDFYAALMDYGAFLKTGGVKLNSRSKHYSKQSKFEGSARQLRGALLRELLKKSETRAALIKKFSPARSRGEIEKELNRLLAEGLVTRRARVLEAGGSAGASGPVGKV